MALCQFYVEIDFKICKFLGAEIDPLGARGFLKMKHLLYYAKLF